MAPNITLLSYSGDLVPGATTEVSITMINEGSAALNYPMVDLEGDQYLTISDIEFNNAFWWDTGMQEILSANVHVSRS